MENEIRKQWKLNAVAREFVIPNPESVIPNLVRDLFRAGLFRNLIFLVVLLFCSAVSLLLAEERGSVDDVIVKKYFSRDKAPVREKRGEKQYYEIKRVALRNGKGTVVVSAEFAPIGDAGGFSSKGSILQYLDKNGKVLWEKRNVDVNSEPKLSSDGKRVFVIEVRSQEEDDELFTHAGNREPMLYDEKGNLLWAFGVYDDADEIYLTKNGKYGYFRYRDPIVDGKKKFENGMLFFDVEKKRTHKKEDAAYAYLTEDGKVTIYEDVGIIIIRRNGSVDFTPKDSDGKRRRKFEKPYEQLTNEEFKYFTAEEIKKIKEAVKDKKHTVITREKTIYEYSFK